MRRSCFCFNTVGEVLRKGKQDDAHRISTSDSTEKKAGGGLDGGERGMHAAAARLHGLISVLSGVRVHLCTGA